MRIINYSNALQRQDGVSIFSIALCNELVKLGNEVTAICWHENTREKLDAAVKLKAVEDLVAELDASVDVVHIHAVWIWWTIKAMWWCVRHRVPYVVSPHGGLMPRVFTKGRIKKRLIWYLGLRLLLRRAALLHCTSIAEKEAVADLIGSRCPPIVVAPLGVCMPEQRSVVRPSYHTLLFVGRLSEEKGLVKLLDVWKTLPHTIGGTQWRLVIAGPNRFGYQKVLDDKIEAEQIVDVDLPGVVDGDKKDALYRVADIFVLPSPMENFSHVVLEALAYGVPTIATQGTPWSELESEHCGRWIEQGMEPLAAALRELMAMSDGERQAMGENGRHLAAAKYQWNSVARVLVDAYAGIRR